MNMSWFDRWSVRMSRSLASRISRRSFLTRLGTVLAGTAAYPLLPVARGATDAQGNPEDPGDPTSCDYWRYCGMDGALCSCCGGTTSSCPPGTEPSVVSWIGTCRNPSDNKDYVISYHDCCGKTICPRCACTRNEGVEPIYRPSKSNEINWCTANANTVINCSNATIIAVATQPDH